MTSRDVFAPSPTRAAVQWTGLVLGPLLAAICFVLLPVEYPDAGGAPVAFSTAGRFTLAVMAWMAVWWLTEAIPISATALLPLAAFPLGGAATMADTAAPYANPLIFLFMGGFMLALSMQRWGLDKRIALVTLWLVGTSPRNMIGGIMLATAMLSAFVSNTATAAMMLPIALSVIALVTAGGTPPGQTAAGVGQSGISFGDEGEFSTRNEESGQLSDNENAASNNDSDSPAASFSTCMLLGLAYSASVGGIATIIGTPPNALLVGFVSETIAEPYRMQISFARWLLISLPLTAVFLPVNWLLLTYVLYPVRIARIPGGRRLIRSQLDALGPTHRGEWITMFVFFATAACWITRPLLVEIGWPAGDGVVYPLSGLSDAGIAMTGALLLFVIPVDWRRGQFTLDWETARRLPWGILILFGGGLSLAGAVESNGVAEFLGSQTRHLAGFSTLVLVLAVTTAVIFLTELTSNTATTATLLPVLAALAPGLGVHPYYLIFPAALAASCAFMMPVATPPNAIVFGSGQLTIRQMSSTGLWLNLIGIALVTTLAMLLIGPVLGVNW